MMGTYLKTCRYLNCYFIKYGTLAGTGTYIHTCVANLWFANEYQILTPFLFMFGL